MKLQEIFENEQIGVNDKIKLLYDTSRVSSDNYATYIRYYNGKHDILTRSQIHRKTGKKIELNNLVFNLCKKIVDTTAFFMFSNPPKLVLHNQEYEDEFEIFKKSWRDAKVDSFNIELAKTLFSETVAGELIYAPSNKSNGSIRYHLLKMTQGEFAPHFDDYGDMDGFWRKYKLDKLIDGKIKEVQFLDVYYQVNDQVIWKRYTLQHGGNYLEEPIDNAFSQNKIPVVYYNIKEPLFWKIKTLQDRFNLVKSNNADTNDYFADPKLKLFGDIVRDQNNEIGIRKKQTGEVIHLASYVSATGQEVKSDAEYLTWNAIPESVKFEIEDLFNKIMYLTDTPNISFDNLKGINSPSGIAIELMFLQTILAVKSYESDFFHLQRRINIHKDMLATLEANPRIRELDITAEFQSPLPINILEEIQSLSQAYNSGIMSQETAVANNPYVSNSVEEMDNINNNAESFDLPNEVL